MSASERAGAQPRPAAHLQPEECDELGAAGLHTLEEHGHSDAEREGDARLAQLEAEHDHVERLRKTGFAGPAYEIFTAALAAYGIPVIRAWIRTRRIYTLSRDRDRGRGVALSHQITRTRARIMRHSLGDLETFDGLLACLARTEATSLGTTGAPAVRRRSSAPLIADVLARAAGIERAVAQEQLSGAFAEAEAALVAELRNRERSRIYATGSSGSAGSKQAELGAVRQERLTLADLQSLPPSSRSAHRLAQDLVAQGEKNLELAREFDSVIAVGKAHGDVDLVHRFSEMCLRTLSTTEHLREGALEARILIEGQAWYLLREHRLVRAAAAAEDGTRIAEKHRDLYTAARGTCATQRCSCAWRPRAPRSTGTSTCARASSSCCRRSIGSPRSREHLP